MCTVTCTFIVFVFVYVLKVSLFIDVYHARRDGCSFRAALVNPKTNNHFGQENFLLYFILVMWHISLDKYFFTQTVKLQLLGLVHPLFYIIHSFPHIFQSRSHHVNEYILIPGIKTTLDIWDKPPTLYFIVIVWTAYKEISALF